MQVHNFLFRKNVLNVKDFSTNSMDIMHKDFGSAPLPALPTERKLKKCLSTGGIISNLHPVEISKLYSIC